VVPVIMVAVAISVAVLATVLAAPPGPAARSSAPAPRRGQAHGLATHLRRLEARHLPHRVASRRDRQLPELLDRLAAALRAGDGLRSALGGLAGRAPEPLAADLEPLRRSLASGTALSTAVATWSGDRADRDVRLVAAALLLGATAGGEVARALDRTAASLRERHELASEVHALATQARASAVVLAVAPVGFGALVGTVEPAATTFLLTTPVGLACVALGVGLDALGSVWMARITRSAS
jgi:tight adherence protein B